MKRFILVLSLISILFLAGCNKNENVNNNQNNNLPQNLENQQHEILNNNEDNVIRVSKEVAKSYIAIINSIEKIVPNEHKYKLAYINDDEEPELIVDKPGYYTGIITSLEDKMYIVKQEEENIDTNNTAITNNSIDKLNSLDLLSYGVSRRSEYDYVAKANLISCVIPGVTSSGIEIFKLDGNILRMESYLSTQLFDGLLPVNEEDINENVNIDLLETKYYLNGNEISEKEYIEKTSVLSNSESLENDTISASEVVEYISVIANIENNQTQIDEEITENDVYLLRKREETIDNIIYDIFESDSVTVKSRHMEERHDYSSFEGESLYSQTTYFSVEEYGKINVIDNDGKIYIELFSDSNIKYCVLNKNILSIMMETPTYPGQRYNVLNFDMKGRKFLSTQEFIKLLERDTEQLKNEVKQIVYNLLKEYGNEIKHGDIEKELELYKSESYFEENFDFLKVNFYYNELGHLCFNFEAYFGLPGAGPAKYLYDLEAGKVVGEIVGY